MSCVCFFFFVQADKIVVIEKGRVVETGTHESLYHQGGAYKSLVDKQFVQSPIAGPAVPVPGNAAKGNSAAGDGAE